MRMSNFIVMHRFTEKNPRFVTLLLELTTGHLVRYVTQCVLARVSQWRLAPLYIYQCRAITTELLLTFHRWGHLESNFATRSQANILYNETEIYSHISYYRWVKRVPAVCLLSPWHLHLTGYIAYIWCTMWCLTTKCLNHVHVNYGLGVTLIQLSIHNRKPVNSPHKAEWRGALMITLICTRYNWPNNGDAGGIRRHRAQYDVTVMLLTYSGSHYCLGVRGC